MKQNKGISLLSLIISIVVVVILSAAVILTITKNNPIKSASSAVELSNLATVEEAFQQNVAMGLIDITIYPVTSLVNNTEIDDITKTYISDSQQVAGIWNINWSKVYYLDLEKLGINKMDIKIKDKNIDMSKFFIVDQVGNNVIYNNGIKIDEEKYYSYSTIKNSTANNTTTEELKKNKIYTSFDSQTYLLKENGEVYSVGKVSSNNLIGLPQSMYTDIENIPVKTDMKLNDNEQLSKGYNYSVVLNAKKEVLVIGNNAYGQLGLGDTVDRYTLTNLNMTGVKQIYCSDNTTFYLKDNGDIYASGKNLCKYIRGDYYLIKENGQDIYTTPVKVDGINNVEKIMFVTDFCVTVKKTDGTFWGFGADCFGSFGLGKTMANRVPTEFTKLKEIATAKGTKIKDIQSRLSTVALLENGEVYTTGYGGYGCIGDGTYNFQDTFKTTPILTNIEKIVLGDTWCYAIKNDSKVLGWGGNQPIGTIASKNGTAVEILSPSEVAIPNIIDIFQNFAITSDNSIYKLGLNRKGEFNKKYDSNIKALKLYSPYRRDGVYIKDVDNNIWSLGSTDRSMFLGEYGYRARALKSAYTNVSDIYASFNNILYKTKDNKLYGAGTNIYGGLGLGVKLITPIAKNINISSIQSIRQIVMNTKDCDISYILDSNNKIYNSGANTYGQSVTNNSVNTFTLADKNLPSGDIIEKIYAKDNSLFVKTTNGKMYAMGRNLFGDLGVGSISESILNFTQITKDVDNNSIDFNNALVITNGFSFTYMLMRDQTIYVFGNNSKGQLGLSTVGTIEPSIKKMNWFKDRNIEIADIKIGEEFAVFLTKTGDVYTIGDNSSGQLGIGSRVNSLEPVKVNIQDVEEVVVSRNYTIVIKKDGSVYSFGKNDYGQCATRTLEDILSPTKAIELMR